MGTQGRLTSLDVSKEWTDIALKYWKKAGVDQRIELILGPALETLGKLKERKAEFDFGFVDADKANQTNYIKALLGLVRKGGFILVDNTLYKGLVL